MKRRLPHLLALAGLLILPLILLWPCLVGDKTFVPWDIAQFAPAATMMDAAEHAAVTENNNTIVTEIPAMFVPELRFLKSELERGQLPHWNPYARSGTAAWSSSILGIWTPINWMLMVGGDPEDDLALGAFLSIAIAGLLMYGLLVHLGLSIPAALFGAMAFAMSGTLTVNLHFYQRINALIWLPGILWAISAIGRAEGRRRVPAMLGLAVCMFMTHTAGFPPFALAVTLIAIAFTLVELVGALRHGGARSAGELALATGGGAVLGVLLASVQSMPMFAFFPESNRALEQVDNYFASGGFDPAGWLGYLCPTLFNHPHINNTGELLDQFSPFFWLLFSRASWVEEVGIPAGTVFTPNLNFCEYTVFVGTLPLFLAVAGLCGKRAPLRWFAAGSFVVLFLLGSATQLVEPVLEAVPFKWIPPTRYTGATCMMLALLAAAGIHNLRELGTAVRRGLWITGLGLCAVCLVTGLWVYGQSPDELLAWLSPHIQAKYAARHPHVPAAELPGMVVKVLGQYMPLARSQAVHGLLTAALACGLCGLLFLLLPRLLRWRHGHPTVLVLAGLLTAGELLGFGIPLNTGRILHRRPLNQTPVHQFLRDTRDRDAERVGGVTVMRAHDADKRSVVTLPSQLPPDTLLNEHIRDMQFYTFVDGRSHKPFLELYGPEQLARSTWPMSVRDDENLQLPYWDMLGIRYILSEDVLKFAGERVGPVLSGPENAAVKTRHFYIYERPHPLPRAWVVHDFRDVGKDDDAMVQALISPEFRPAEAVLLDSATVVGLGDRPHRSKSKGNQRAVRFPELARRHQTNSLTIEVAAGEPGYLVVNDTYMSGWTVTINGQPARIHRGNLFQRVLVLPGDKAIVQFDYTTPGFHLGVVLSVLALLVGLGLGIWYAWHALSRRRRHRVEETQ